MNLWLRLVTYWFTAEAWQGVSASGELGWSVGRLELCCDFTGLRVDRDFAEQFHTAQRASLIREGLSKARSAGNVDVGNRHAEAIGVHIHNKTRQVRRTQGVEVAASVYAPAFLDPYPSKWDGRATIYRVELRASGRALRLCDAQGVRIDLSDPASLVDKKSLGLFWLKGTHLSQEKVGGTTSARWRAVQAACGLPVSTPVPKYAPRSRSGARKPSLTARMRKAARLMVRGELPHVEAQKIIDEAQQAGREGDWRDCVAAATSAFRPDARGGMPECPG